MIRRFFIVFLLSVFFASSLFAGAFDLAGLNARPIGMGTVYTASGLGINAIKYNPAGAAEARRVQLIFSYRDFYGLNLINQKNIGVLVPGKKVNVGLSWHRIGTSDNVEFMDYNEDSFTISFAGKLKYEENFFGGININLYKVTSVNNATAYGIDAGLQKHGIFFDRLQLGVYAENFIKSDLVWDTGANDELETILRFGLSYKPQLRSVYGIDYDINNRLNLGGEYWVYKRMFAVRAGAKNLLHENIMFSAGMSLNIKGFQFDYALTGHGELGFTHFFTVEVKAGRLKR